MKPEKGQRRGKLQAVKQFYFRNEKTSRPSLSRWVYLVLAVLQVMFQAGIIFGWPNLELILKREGYFDTLCTAEQLQKNDCPDKVLALSNVYLAGSLCVFIGAPIVGILVDKIGPRFATTVGIFFTGLYYLFFSMSSPENPYLLFPAFISLGLQHNMLIFPLFSVANMFPKHREFAMSVITGTSDAGTLTFLIWEAVHNMGYSLHTILLVHGCIFGVIAAVSSLFVWPARPFPLEASEEGFAAIPSAPETPSLAVPNPLGQDTKETPVDIVPLNPADVPQTQGSDGGTWAPSQATLPSTLEELQPQMNPTSAPQTPHRRWKTRNELLANPLGKQLSSPECLSLLLWVGLTILSMNYVFGSIDAQMNSYGQSGGEYTTYFGIIAAAGTIGGPLTGWFMGRFGFMTSAWVVCSMNLLRTILSAIPALPVQIPAFIMFVVSRGWLFSFMTAYSSTTFGQFTFSRIVGIAVVVGAVFSPLQYPLISLGLDLNNFVYSNLVMVGIAVISFIMPITIAVGRKKRRQAEATKKLELTLSEVVPSKVPDPLQEKTTFPEAEDVPMAV